MKHETETKEKLGHELQVLRDRVAQLEEMDAQRQRVEQQLRVLSRDLGERVKELNCLYGISSLRERPGIAWNELIQGIVELIRNAWQYPEITCARVVLSGQEFRTQNFQQTPWKQARDLHVHSRRMGALEVYYVAEKPLCDEGPFLKEERALLEAVGSSIERMVEQRETEETTRAQHQQLIHLDKMVALGTLVSGVAHEINNPNNFIMLNTPVLLEAFQSVMPILDEYQQENGDFLVGGLQFTEMRESIPLLFSGILEGSKRIKTIVEGLKGFARVETPDLSQLVEINNVVKSALLLVGNQIKKSTRRFSVEYVEPLPLVRGNGQRLEQVIINLVQNACEALPDMQRAIAISTFHDQATDSVVVKVRDEGIGIAPEKLPMITEPFYTTKRSAGGTGLGLSVSTGIVKDHGGSLKFESTPGKGTTATVSLPVSSDKAIQPEAVR